MDDESSSMIPAYIAMLTTILRIRMLAVMLTHYLVTLRHRRNRNTNRGYSIKDKITRQLDHMAFLTQSSDIRCRDNLRVDRDNLRVDRDCFNRLCYLLQNLGGLTPTRHVTVAEQVAILLTVLSHHTKNRVVSGKFRRSGYTISKHFNSVLSTLLKLHTTLLVTPQPVADDCDDNRWKCFEGCLGALDGTHIPVQVSAQDIPRYRNRKGDISVNVLGVCDRNMNYIYVLSGWEGSAADSRVLRDAITRHHGLKIPIGNYYLVDGGYTNGNGFLAPYRGVRYHLREWDATNMGPQNYQEFFNRKHAKARNVIERSFGILKARWGILRSNSYYPIKTHNRIILGCCLLHNFIRTNMAIDPVEVDVPEYAIDDDVDDGDGGEYVNVVEPSQAWTNWRDDLATKMFAGNV